MFSSKNLIFSFLFILVTFFGYSVFAFFQEDALSLDFSSAKKISLNDNGLTFETKTMTNSIFDFLKEKNISVNEYDLIIPEKKSAILPGTNITIKRALRIQLSADGKEKEFYTLVSNVSEAIADSGIILGEDDLVAPAINTPLKNDLDIIITRVKTEEQIVKKNIAYKTISEDDDSLGWRVKKIKQRGEKGTEEIKYKIVSHNGKEISHKIIARETVKEPVAEIVVQGTYVKTGKSHTGLGTWYAFRGGLFAASPWLPMGSFAKVINKSTGASIIVQINDRGPFGENRIIDLDKVAFQKIASLGAGVIDVKVEEILN